MSEEFKTVVKTNLKYIVWLRQTFSSGSIPPVLFSPPPTLQMIKKHLPLLVLCFQNLPIHSYVVGMRFYFCSLLCPACCQPRLPRQLFRCDWLRQVHVIVLVRLCCVIQCGDIMDVHKEIPIQPTHGHLKLGTVEGKETGNGAEQQLSRD